MAKKKGFQGAYIPIDWQESDGYCRVTLCIPNSKDWRATFRGLIDSLRLGYYWRADGVGRITTAQAIGREIYGSMCMSCNYEEIEQQKIEQLKEIAKAVKQLQKDTAANNACLLATQKAINDALGGPSVEGCDDSSVPADCQPTAQTWDGLVYIADETVSIVETFGSYLATPIVNFLIGARWFTMALLAVGLAEPSPTEEAVTVPLAGVVEAITYFVETAIEIGTSSARAAVDELKANRNGDVDKLCQADETTIDETLDDIVDTVKDVFSDPQVQQSVKNLLDGFFKAPPVKGVILTK